MPWVMLSTGALLLVLGLAAALLEMWVERHKPVAARKWRSAWIRVGQAGRPAIGGFLIVTVAIFMLDPLTGLRVLIAPVGTVMAAALLLLLIASWRAVRAGTGKRETWQAVTDRSRQLAKSCCMVLVVACAFYALVLLGSKVDDLTRRLQSLEVAQQASAN